MSDSAISASEIRLRRAENILAVTFEDGYEASLPAEYLRVESPSAELQGHTGQRSWIGGKRNVAITAVTPTGNYAIRLTFSDGHDTGIYTWDLLYQLGREQTIRWRRYLAMLEQAGLTRD
jgi:DUF971 family protein